MPRPLATSPGLALPPPLGPIAAHAHFLSPAPLVGAPRPLTPRPRPRGWPPHFRLGLGAAAPERSHWTCWARRAETTTPGRQCAGTRAHCRAVGGPRAARERGGACARVRGRCCHRACARRCRECAGKRWSARAGVRGGVGRAVRGVARPPAGSGLSWRPGSGHSIFLGGRGRVSVGPAPGSRAHSARASGLLRPSPPHSQRQTPGLREGQLLPFIFSENSNASNLTELFPDRSRQTYPVPDQDRGTLTTSVAQVGVDLSGRPQASPTGLPDPLKGPRWLLPGSSGVPGRASDQSGEGRRFPCSVPTWGLEPCPQGFPGGAGGPWPEVAVTPPHHGPSGPSLTSPPLPSPPPPAPTPHPGSLMGQGAGRVASALSQGHWGCTQGRGLLTTMGLCSFQISQRRDKMTKRKKLRTSGIWTLKLTRLYCCFRLWEDVGLFAVEMLTRPRQAPGRGGVTS